MKQRWYEQDQTLKQSIDLLQVFPDEILDVIAEGVNSVAEKEFKAKELMRDYKSLGQDTVLSLYKSKRKQRSYDKVPTMTTLINYIMLLPVEHRKILAAQIIELSEVIQQYLDECGSLQVKPEVAQIKVFRDTYLNSGYKQARQALEKVCEELRAKPKEGTFVRNFNESSDGLKLNFKRVD